MAASGSKNAVLLIVVIVLLGAAAFISKDKFMGGSAEDQIAKVREVGDALKLKMGRQINKEEMAGKFGRVSFDVKFDEDAKDIMKSAKLIVSGQVQSEEDKRTLEGIVTGGNPPFPVEWSVKIDAKTEPKPEGK